MLGRMNRICRLVVPLALAPLAGCGARTSADISDYEPKDGGIVRDAAQDSPIDVKADAKPDAGAEAGTKTDWVLFVTEGRWRANELGGLGGADARCNQEGAKLGGPFVALLSDSQTRARDRLPSSHRLLNAAGMFMLGDTGDFFPLRNFKAQGIAVNLNAAGKAVYGYNPAEVAWWGSNEHGEPTCGECCADFTTAAPPDEGAASVDPELGLIGGWPGCVIGNPVRLICVGPKK